jgi:hypothetical protein
MGKPPKAVLSPRPAPDPAAVEAYISGKPILAPAATEPEPPTRIASQTAAPHPLPQAAAQTKRTVIRRKDGRELYRTTIYLEPELAQRAGIFALKQGIDQTDVIKAALSDYLTRHGG